MPMDTVKAELLWIVMMPERVVRVMDSLGFLDSTSTGIP